MVLSCFEFIYRFCCASSIVTPCCVLFQCVNVSVMFSFVHDIVHDLMDTVDRPTLFIPAALYPVLTLAAICKVMPETCCCVSINLVSCFSEFVLRAAPRHMNVFCRWF